MVIGISLWVNPLFLKRTFAKESLPTLPLKDFIQLATEKDTTFETILIDQYALKYRGDLLLPDGSLIADLKYQYNFYLDQDRNNPESTLSLSKLFPNQGTDVSVSYNKSSSAFTETDTSSLQLLISQPIAKNAFGRGTKLLDNIIGVENEISRFQIIEAYEDYLASLTVAYYNWYSAYENLQVGKASHHSNKKLLNNILDRQRQNIALPIDVNKMKLLLASKKENLIVLQETYDNISNLIYKAIRLNTGTAYIPTKSVNSISNVQFDRDYENFTNISRTYKTLRLLEDKSTLEVKKSADDLLPSTNLLLGYKVEGEDWGVNNEENIFFAGIDVSWPIGRKVNKAQHQITKIEQKKTALSNQNKYEELRTNLTNLFQQIQREQQLITVSQQKISLAEAILKDEAENYSYGKVTLNDYIDAVNLVDESKFNHTRHGVQLNKLLVEWLRMTDRLVDKKLLSTDE